MSSEDDVSPPLSSPVDFEGLLDYLKRTRGFDFTGYKRTTLTRRIDKRMQTIGVDGYSAYRDYLEVDAPEINELFNTILINVTSFFRDPEAWDYLAKNILPEIIEKKGKYDLIRVWSAGCASGEEAFSLAMLFAETLGIQETINRVKIFATDLDNDALTTGRQGIYPAKALQDLPEGYLAKYFQRRGDDYIFNRELRRAVIFGKHDIANDIPISQIDLLVCRNALMYFNAETQKRILQRLHFALANPGYLFLGKAEMLLLRSNDYEPVDIRLRLFKKVKGNVSEKRLSDRLIMLARAQEHDPSDSSPPLNLLNITEASFDQYPIAQLIVDADGILLLANQNARTMFNLHQGHIGKPFKELEMAHRPVDLTTLGRQVMATRQAAHVKDVELRLSQTEVMSLDLHAAPLLDGQGTVLGMRYVFTDTTRLRHLQDELEERRQELETAYEELQSSNEELTTTNEELQSTVEELETTNEELQSTNEELETINEELQSTNEELETVSNLIDSKRKEVDELNHFLTSVLGSLKSAIIVVDQDMHVLVWNKMCEETWGLRSEEVINENVFALDIGLPLEQLHVPIRKCLFEEKEQIAQVLEARNRRGKLVQVKVICMPLRQLGSDKTQRVLIIIDEVEQADQTIEVPASA